MKTKEKNEIIESVKTVYKNSKVPVLLVDTDTNIVWTNSDEILGFFPKKSLSSFVDKDILAEKHDDFAFPIDIKGHKYSVSFLAISDDDDEIYGYVTQFLSVGEIFKHYVNKDFASHHIGCFANVRTHLSGILSTITLLQTVFEDKEMYNELKVLNNQANYCYKILAAILNPTEITKYAFGIFNIVTLNAKHFLKEIFKYIEYILTPDNIKINFTCEDDIYIDVDTDRFVVMLMNVIVNSIENNIEDMKEISISLKATSSNAVLIFSDNGSGIANDTLDYLNKNSNTYLPDYLTDNRCGYGLNIIKEFCKTFQSTMVISTKEDKGTTVAIRIPLSSEDKYPKFLESKVVDYISNRFSNIHILLSKVTQLHYI